MPPETEERCARSWSARSKATARRFEELYLLHFDRIYSYLQFSVGNKHDAEDLTNQTFVKMIESIDRFEWRKVPISAWLFRIAHNLAMDHFRSRRRWQPEEEPPEPPGSEGALGRGRGLPRRSGSRACSS